MDSYPCSTLAAGPLSVAAQTVMAALRAQYAGRIHKSRHINSLSEELRLFQNQEHCSRPSELHIQSNISWEKPYHTSRPKMEKAIQSPNTNPTEEPSYYPESQWSLIREEKEKQCLNHSPKLQLSNVADVSPFHSNINTLNRQKTDQLNLRLSDYSNGTSLLVLSADRKGTVAENNIPETDSHRKKTFLRTTFAYCGDPQLGTTTVVSQEQKHQEISSKTGKIQVMHPTKKESKAKRVTHSPPCKRWRSGHVQMPVVSCFKDFVEEEDNGLERAPAEQNCDESSGEKEVWYSEEKRNESTEIVCEEWDHLYNIGISEMVRFNLHWSEDLSEECCDEGLVCANGQKEHLTSLQPVLLPSHVNDIIELRLNREPVKISSDFAESSTLDQFRNKENHLQLSIQNADAKEDTMSMQTALHSTNEPDQDTVLKEGGSADMSKETEESRPEESEASSHKTDLPIPQPEERNVHIEADVSIEPDCRAAPVVTEMHPKPQDLSQVDIRSSGMEGVAKTVLMSKKPGKWIPPQPSQGHSKIILSQETFSKQTTGMPEFSSPLQKSSPSQHNDLLISYQRQQSKSTKQFQNPLKSVQSLKERPVQTPTTQLELINKKEPRVDSRCDISKPSREKCSASEMNSHQRASEGDKKGDGTPASSKLTLALTCDSRVCDASRLSPEEKMGVLEEAGRARALVVTMVYQDGTTQLDPEQKATPAVCGLLVLLKKSLDALDLEQTETTEERLLFLRLEQRPVWAQQDPQHNQDLFTKEVLLQMVCGTQRLVCFKAKDLLRTALRHFNRDLSWKQVAGCQVLDPQIAAWLLDPADSACCFQDLLIKHCTRPANHTSAQPALGHSKVTQTISSLSLLHRLMVELRNKLQTQGLWQLYFCMEQKMIPVLAAMESHRIHVDKAALKKTSEMLGTKVKQLEQEAHQAAGQQFLVSSSAQLRLLLQLQDLHPLPKIILEYRQAHKIKSTFVDGILSCMTKSFISSTWNQTSTVSGRLSAKHPNFQALPKQPIQITKKQSVEGKESELVTVHPRTMFIPREGWSFLSADFCQVELRLLAHLSSDPELLRIFQNPEADVFTMLASQWKGVSKDTVSSEDREHAKRIVYSVVYGAGRERLSGILGVSSEEASRFQDTFLQTYREVQTFIQHTVQYCHKHGYVKSIMGRRRSLPHVHSTDWGIRNQAERQAVNFVVQGSAADLCKMAMIHICSHVSSSATLTARLVAQIHDELLFEVEDSQVEDFAVLVKKTMESLQHIDCLGVRLTVPLKVSVSKGRSWGSMCELSFPRAATHTSP
ncbi:DNA polymerase nu isoform X2 [Astyanax mexicanus]|uniref:DNA polymerase nu isoform X2 n=1 Tax=Astyanax mexicanus TaxID=7994 RepID=UPI0020CACE7F|nr:DNA polymerase nu isoform X2 [Astyanax mexicanus]